MAVRTMSVFVLCTAVCLAGAHMSQGQEATSANLPDQFQTGEMIQIHKPKKKKSEPSSQTVATASKQNTALTPKQSPPAEELPTQVVTEEKKAEPGPGTASAPQIQKMAPVTEQMPPAEESAPGVVPVEKKPR